MVSSIFLHYSLPSCLSNVKNYHFGPKNGHFGFENGPGSFQKYFHLIGSKKLYYGAWNHPFWPLFSMVTGLIPHCVLTKNHFIDEKITTVQGVELYVQKVKRQFFWLIHTSKSPEKLWKPKDHLSYMLGYCCNYVIIFRHFLVVSARMPKFWVFGGLRHFFLLILTSKLYFHW